MDVSKEFGAISDLGLFACPACSLRYFHPPCAGSSSFYEPLGRQPWYYMESKWEHDRALADMPSGSNVLEIGCGKGSFLARLSSERACRVLGLETNEEAAGKARAEGRDVRSLRLEELIRSGVGPFDAICSFQVLEHLEAPRRFLEDCIALLSPRGLLVVAVPNADGFLKDYPFLTEQPPHHVTLWNRKTLENLASLLPLSLVRVEFEPLAEYHVDAWIAAHANRTRVPSSRGSFLRSLRIRLLKKLLAVPALRRRVHGHTLYALYRKEE